MGVKLTSLLPRKEIHFSNLRKKKIAIDFSNMAYQFLSSIRNRDGSLLTDSKGHVTSLYVGIFSRISNLYQQDILPCFVFDGIPPAVKTNTIRARKERKAHAAVKYRLAQHHGDMEAMSKYARQTSRLTPDLVQGSKTLLTAMGLPCIQAPSEADAQIAHMCEMNHVDYAATSDVDPLLFGCPRIITNLTLSQRRRLSSGAIVKITPEVLELSTILRQLGISRDQFLVIAILVGTDYNQGVKGIGPKTALKLVKQYTNFDNLFQEVKFHGNWKKVYAIFKSMSIMKSYQLRWKEPDVARVRQFLVTQHDFSEERVMQTLQKLIKREKHQAGLGSYLES